MTSADNTDQNFNIFLNGRRYEVRLVSNVLKSAKELKFEGMANVTDEEDYGMISADRRMILIDSSLTQEERDSTLFHELLHGTVPHLGEHTILRIEESLYPLLRKHGLRFTKPNKK